MNKQNDTIKKEYFIVKDIKEYLEKYDDNILLYGICNKIKQIFYIDVDKEFKDNVLYLLDNPICKGEISKKDFLAYINTNNVPEDALVVLINNILESVIKVNYIYLSPSGHISFDVYKE